MGPASTSMQFGVSFPGSMNGLGTVTAHRGRSCWVSAWNRLPMSACFIGSMAYPMFFSSQVSGTRT